MCIKHSMTVNNNINRIHSLSANLPLGTSGRRSSLSGSRSDGTSGIESCKKRRHKVELTANFPNAHGSNSDKLTIGKQLSLALKIIQSLQLLTFSYTFQVKEFHFWQNFTSEHHFKIAQLLELKLDIQTLIN